MIIKGNTTNDGIDSQIADAIGVWAPSKKLLIAYGFSEELEEQKRQEILSDPLVSFGHELLLARASLALHGKDYNQTWLPAIAFHAFTRSSNKEIYTMNFFGPENSNFEGLIEKPKTYQLTPPTDDQKGFVKVETRGKYYFDRFNIEVAWDLHIEAEVTAVQAVSSDELR